MGVIAGIQLDIFLGEKRVTRCPECMVTASRRSVLTQASIAVPDPMGEVHQALDKGQSLSVRFGYRDRDPGVFTGTVTRWAPSLKAKEHVVIHADGPERALLTTHLTESWFEEPANVLARRMLAASGLPVGHVDLPDTLIPRMSVNGSPVRGAIMGVMHSLESGFSQNLSRSYLRLENGALVLSDAPREGAVPVIATAGGIIRHKVRTEGPSEVETFLTPWMQPGMQFQLNDTRKGVQGLFMADAVTHVLRPRSVRTFLSYGGSYDRFQC
ncbi:hypothetical protein [Desulfoluna spongiiphila]|uniref:Uncharacterized protein n=1 Tax=Desulfoluna spongiiphila TaxID=419481 RepID=A0A1G5JKG9_9BACT|nr:hypothetical protein [Desulfoluna spongiiphila]SCY88249.1 hypothetical protein SAMN05216233_1329 [Desulfoluna spongiiphila]